MLDRSDGESLRSGFLRNAKAHPDRPAVVVRGGTLSYGQLESTARRWAGAITEACGRRPERVGLFAYRSEVSYAGTLATLFAGATFVPLNPTFPPEKTAAMIVRAELDAILVDKACLPHLSKVFSEAPSLPVLLPENDAAECPFKGRILGKAELESAQPL